MFFKKRIIKSLQSPLFIQSVNSSKIDLMANVYGAILSATRWERSQDQIHKLLNRSSLIQTAITCKNIVFKTRYRLIHKAQSVLVGGMVRRNIQSGVEERGRGGEGGQHSVGPPILLSRPIKPIQRVWGSLLSHSLLLLLSMVTRCFFLYM